MKKIIIILLIIAIAIAACVGISVENRPITDERDLEFKYVEAELRLKCFTAQPPQGGQRWIEAKKDNVFLCVWFGVTNTNKKAQKITKPFILKVAESDLMFEDRCPWAEMSLAEREIEAHTSIYAYVCFEVPEELAESAFLIEHNGQQWQIPPVKRGSN